MTTYTEMTARIKRVKTRPNIDRLEKSMKRLYDAGFLTPSQLKRLDTLLMERNATLES